MMNFKKTIASVLCAFCVFSFTACKDVAETVKEKFGMSSAAEVTNEEKAKETVENFLDAVVSLDAEKATEYVSNPQSVYDKFKFLIPAEPLEETISAEIPVAGFIAKLISPFVGKIVDSVSDSLKKYYEYEIVSCQSSDVGYNVNVMLTVPDTSDPSYIKGQLEALYSDESVKEIFGEMAKNGEVPANTDSLEMLKSAPKIVGRLLDKMSEIEFRTQTLNMEIPVSEYDGEWLINVDELNN